MLRRITEIAIACLIAANCIGLAAFFILRSRTGIYEDGGTMPVPSGYLIDTGSLPAGGEPCYLIHLTAVGCAYCRAGQPRFLKLGARSREAGCETVTIAPKVGEVALGNGPAALSQLQYIDMPFSRAIVPYTVPQTILLGGTGKILWYRVGEMDDGAVADAINALPGAR